LNFYKAFLDADKEKKKLQEQRALALHREAIRRETKKKEQQSKAEQKQKETQEKQNQVQFLWQQAMPGGGMMGMQQTMQQQTMQQPMLMFNAGHVINPHILNFTRGVVPCKIYIVDNGRFSLPRSPVGSLSLEVSTILLLI